MSAENNQRFLNLEAAAMDAAGRGIQALLVLNGGACLGILSLYGVFATSAHLRAEFLWLMGWMPCALIFFASGAFLTIPVSIGAYSANQNYANAIAKRSESEVDYDRLWDRGVQCNKCALRLVVLSAACFVIGVFILYSNLPDIQPPKANFDQCANCILSS